MQSRNIKKPSYPLKEIKRLIREEPVIINEDAQNDAYYDFKWKPEDIKKCILKFNDKYHFWKTEKHGKYPGVMMDYYKAYNIMDGFNVYTHFYISPQTGFLTISSFKEI